jgi:uncharacterized protein YcbX
MHGHIAALYRHPLKGFTPQPIDAAILTPGAHFPCDRLYAVEDGPSGFDAAAPRHLSKQRFTVLAKLPALARVVTHYDEDTGVLDARAEGQAPLSVHLTRPEGRIALARWLTGFLGEDACGPLRVLAAPDGHRFMDSRDGFVSVLNLDGVADLGRRLGRPIDPLRFRANIHVQGWPAGSELAAVGRTLRLGAAALEVLSDTVRCAATHVNPRTGERDIDMVAEIFDQYGHAYCGVYARVARGGPVRRGDPATMDDAQ